MNQRKLIRLAAAGVGVIILLIIFSNSLFVTLSPGERGVLFHRFAGGIDMQKVYTPGFHVKAPWDIMYVYDVRKKERKESIKALSTDGLDIVVDVSIRFHPLPITIGVLHNEIGKTYLKSIVIPEARSAVREVIGNYTPEELYSKRRKDIQEQIYSNTKKNLHKNYIALDAILIREIDLPTKIAEAIERKLEEEQRVQEKEFSIQKAKKEAERKKVEAQGIQDFQRIVTEGISRKLLKWKGIEATQELAKSDNSKIIIIGSGEEGLPVIMNTK